MINKLLDIVRTGFTKIKDHRRPNAIYPLKDALMSAYAMFSLKDASLHQFRKLQSERSRNLERVYGIEQIPEDTGLRKIIDGIEPSAIQTLFKAPIEVLQQQGEFEKREVLGGYQCVPIDGTGYYCSSKKSCPHCLVKKHGNEVTEYYHQLLAAVLVHPEQKTVFPVACEAIVRQDGSTKNDCERNAAKRLIPQIRRILPDPKLIIIGDGLYPNGPFIKLLQEHTMSFILGIKEGYVLVQVEQLAQLSMLQSLEWKHRNMACKVTFTNGLILNGQHQDIMVNYLQYEEVDTKTRKIKFKGSWITDLNISSDHAAQIVKVARSRWKIENETFNTLKNQGYHLEHNYGHGKKYLTTNFALLMMLAFLVDQIAQHLDQAFQKAWSHCGTKKNLWEKIRQVFDLLPCKSMNVIYRVVSKDIILDFPLLE